MLLYESINDFNSVISTCSSSLSVLQVVYIVESLSLIHSFSFSLFQFEEWPMKQLVSVNITYGIFFILDLCVFVRERERAHVLCAVAGKLLLALQLLSRYW